MFFAPFAPVGSPATVSTGAAGAAVTAAFSQSPTASHLLVCWVGGTASTATPAPTVPSGWSTAGVPAQFASCATAIFFKVAAGSDTAPTIAAQSGVVWNVQLAEFSGNASSPQDQSPFGSSTTTSPLVLAAGSADFAPGELFVYAACARYSVAGTKTLANALNNGASAVSTNNNGVSTGSHYDFGYGITTSNSAADSDSFSLTTASLTRGTLNIASFKAAIEQPVVIGQAVKRAAFF